MDGQTATAHLSHDVRFNLKAFFILHLENSVFNSAGQTLHFSLCVAYIVSGLYSIQKQMCHYQAQLLSGATFNLVLFHPKICNGTIPNLIGRKILRGSFSGLSKMVTVSENPSISLTLKQKFGPMGLFRGVTVQFEIFWQKSVRKLANNVFVGVTISNVTSFLLCFCQLPNVSLDMSPVTEGVHNKY